MITEMRVADLIVFELIKYIKFVIRCGSKCFELIKTVMEIVMCENSRSKTLGIASQASIQ